MTIVIDTPEGIEAYRLLAIKGALKLETLGMKHSRGSVYAMVKRDYGFKGNKQKVYDQYVAMLIEKGIISED